MQLAEPKKGREAAGIIVGPKFLYIKNKGLCVHACVCACMCVSVHRSTDKKSGKQMSSGRPMTRCSVVQLLLSQASGAMPIVPRLKQKGRKAEDQRRPDGKVHSTTAAVGRVGEEG